MTHATCGALPTPKATHRVKKCTKQAFTSPKAASKHASLLWNLKGRVVYPYRCDICNKYHVSSTAPFEYGITTRRAAY